MTAELDKEAGDTRCAELDGTEIQENMSFETFIISNNVKDMRFCKRQDFESGALLNIS